MGLFSRKGDSYDSIFDYFTSFVVNEYKQLKWTVKRKERSLTAMGKNSLISIELKHLDSYHGDVECSVYELGKHSQIFPVNNPGDNKSGRDLASQMFQWVKIQLEGKT